MVIYTSYFAQLKKVKNPISIALWKPKWYNGPELLSLAPTKNILTTWKKSSQSNADWQNYITSYTNEILNKIDVDILLNQIKQIYPSENFVTLLCYEKPEDYCHRHIVSGWLNKNNITSNEITFRT